MNCAYRNGFSVGAVLRHKAFPTVGNGGKIDNGQFFVYRNRCIVGAAILPPATWQLQPARLNGTTQYTEQCSGDNSSPSSPARGLHRGMLRIQTSNVWPYGQWRQIAAATVGVLYNTVYHSPPQVKHLTWRAANSRPYNTFVLNYRVFNVSIIVLRP